MEETEKPENDGKINTINGGTGAAVTQIVAETHGGMPRWAYLALLIGLEAAAALVGLAILLWPHGAH